MPAYNLDFPPDVAIVRWWRILGDGCYISKIGWEVPFELTLACYDSDHDIFLAMLNKDGQKMKSLSTSKPGFYTWGGDTFTSKRFYTEKKHNALL